jgi:phosphate/sulfate permease
MTFLFILTTIALFSPESVVTTIVGAIVSFGLTNLLKSLTGWQSAAATVLAFVASFVVAIAAVATSTFLSGGSLSWELVGQSALQIFTLATIAYKLLMADPNAPSHKTI